MKKKKTKRKKTGISFIDEKKIVKPIRVEIYAGKNTGIRYDPNETIAEGTITGEQWRKMAKWFNEGKSIFYELLQEDEEKRPSEPEKRGGIKGGDKSLNLREKRKDNEEEES